MEDNNLRPGQYKQTEHGTLICPRCNTEVQLLVELSDKGNLVNVCESCEREILNNNE